MKKTVFGLIGAALVFGFVFAGCDNSTNGNTKGVYSGYGVWLISEANYTAYTGQKQPTPTAMGIIPSLADNFSVDFKEVHNYNSIDNPGWALKTPTTSWTVAAADYYVLIVPIYFPSGIANQGNFWWMFDEGKISSSGAVASKMTISAASFDFALADFVNVK